MPDYKVNPQPWVKDAVRVADDKLVRQIAEDFRAYNPSPRSPLSSPPQTVSVGGAGRVVGGDVGPQHRPIAEQAGSGWTTPPSIDSWRAPGLEHMDRMMDAQDAIDRAARARELAGAAALKKAEAQFLATKAQNEDNKPKSGK
jgi:hypothetical protein